MKIIITERQQKSIKENSNRENIFKKVLFKNWQKQLDKEGSLELESDIVDYIGYKPKHILQINEWFIEFMGGWNKMIEKSYELMDRTFNTMDYDFGGGYDFRFKVQGHSDYEEDSSIYVDCPIESDAEVTLITDDETHLLSKVEENENLWWEVESEIKSLIEDILYLEVTKKTGIMVDVNIVWVI